MFVGVTLCDTEGGVSGLECHHALIGCQGIEDHNEQQFDEFKVQNSWNHFIPIIYSTNILL